MCQNAGFEVTGATIAFVGKRGRIIVAALANVMIHYFVSVAEKLFLHSLDPLQTSDIIRGG